MTDPDVKVMQPTWLKCLMLSRDGICIDHVRVAGNDIGLSIEVSRDLEIFEARLAQGKFEAVIVDLGCGPEAYQALASVRHSPSNQTAAVLTVAEAGEAAIAFMKGSNFILEKPLSRDSILRVFKVAHGWMVRERRRYFRCPVSIPVSVSQSGKDVSCQMVNISEGGMAVITQDALDRTGRIVLRFRLPEHESDCEIEAMARWHKMGISGLQFVTLTSATRSVLNTFLAQKLEAQLPKSVLGKAARI